MSNSIRRFVLATLTGCVLGGATQVMAASLNIADEPLFLGYAVDPNVFFMLDDSGSMDWEITTIPHWSACGYDSAYPESGCAVNAVSDGKVYLYRWTESKESTASTWTVDGNQGESYFQYVFSTGDNLYGTECNSTNTEVASCRENQDDTTDTETTGYEFYCTGYSSSSSNSPKCIQPSGGYCDPAPRRSTVGTCYSPVYTTTTYNHRWNAYAKDWRVYSSDLNTTYYNPGITYKPWSGDANEDGTTDMPDANWDEVRSNPESSQNGYSMTRDLDDDMGDLYDDIERGFVYEVWQDTHGYAGTKPAPGSANRTEGANKYVDVWDEHDRYVVTTDSITKYRITYSIDGSGVLTEDVGAPEVVTSITAAGVTKTADEVRQNIANWYQYSRRRMLMAKGVIGRLVEENNSFRFGMSMINKNATTATTSTTTDFSSIFIKVPDAAVTDYASHINLIQTSLYKYKQQAYGTPLRRGLDNTGRYFNGQTIYKTNENSLSSTTFTNPIIESCQANFAILFTDGYWNDSGDPATSAIADRDGDGYTNTGASENTTVADVARYYADHDLHATFPNNVPVPGTDNETFQHMKTYTAAFGVLSELRDTNDDDLPDQLLNIANGATASFTPSFSAKWGDNPWSENTGKVDDMWHAAYNSGADFISARSPEELIDGLTAAMNEIDAVTGSSSAVAASSGSYRADTMLFLAKFYNVDWAGDVEGYRLTSDTDGNISISTTPAWSAASLLYAQVQGDGYLTDRNVITYNPVLANGSRQGKGVPFLFPTDYPTLAVESLSLSQVTALVPEFASITATEVMALGTERLAWLRGDTSNEGGDYRDRYALIDDDDAVQTVLGDIVDSSPQYVGKPNRLYPDALEGSSHKYSTFRAANTSRTPMLYVGANDGMLHAFKAETGEEAFAYVPAKLYPRLYSLMNTAYSHQYLINSTPEVNDVFYGNAWHTVLIGGLGAGGQGMYALDVTNGAAVDQSDASSTVLWEFTDTNLVSAVADGTAGASGDQNLGYTYSRPQMLRMQNGKWLAVFGNGYNNTEADGKASATGYAYLYFVDIETGKLVKRIEVPVGSTTTPNGLATVTGIDLNADYIIDYIYGGDLYGNIWRFDVTTTATTTWALGNGGDPVFTTATDQPITSKVSVARHPTGSGVLVYFGTGKYIETADADSDDQTTQAFYAIWDNIGVSGLDYPVATDDLLAQSIEAELDLGASSDADVRRTSDSAIDWTTHRGWYMELEVGGSNGGEVIVTDPIVRGDRVIFISIMPAQSPCETGGTSWIYELDKDDGGRLPYSPIDVNNDGEITDDDLVSSGTGGDDVAGGGFKKDNIVTSPTILADSESGGKEHKIMASSAGVFTNLTESTDLLQGRQSWRQLR